MTLWSTFSHLLLFFLMSKMGPTYPCSLCQQKPSLYFLHINKFLDFQSFGTKGWWWLLYDHTILDVFPLCFPHLDLTPLFLKLLKFLNQPYLVFPHFYFIILLSAIIYFVDVSLCPKILP